MSNPSTNTIATRESWKTLPVPEIRENLSFTSVFTVDEFEMIKRGFVPAGMDDKWFIFFDEPWLYFHRSWTGDCVCGIRFEFKPDGVSVVESWITRQISLKGTGLDYDCALLKFLIDAFLLGRPVSFPVPDAFSSLGPPGLYQHSMVGRGYPEVGFPSGKIIPESPRTRWLKWLIKKGVSLRLARTVSDFTVLHWFFFILSALFLILQVWFHFTQS